MTKELDTSSEALKELRQLLDLQLGEARAAWGREREAERAHDEASNLVAAWVMGERELAANGYQLGPCPGEMLDREAETEAAHNHAHIEAESLTEAAARTVAAYLTQLLADNAATLDGMNARYKRTLRLISDAMPEGFGVSHERGSEVGFTCPKYGDLRPETYEWRGFATPSGYLKYVGPVYVNWTSSSELISARTLNRPNFVREPGATPEEIRAQLDGLEAAKDAARAAKKRHKDSMAELEKEREAAADAYAEATSALAAVPSYDWL